MAEVGRAVDQKVRRSQVKGSRAEALAYMPILRTNHVVQGFIPANIWTKAKKQ